MRFKSCDIVRLPVAGVNAKVDRAVELGQYRELVLVTTPGGEQYRVGRTKGVTYRRYPAALGMKRRDHRATARRVA